MALSVSIDLVSSSARVTSVKSTQGVGVTEGHPDTKIGPGRPGSDKNLTLDHILMIDLIKVNVAAEIYFYNLDFV